MTHENVMTASGFERAKAEFARIKESLAMQGVDEALTLSCDEMLNEHRNPHKAGIEMLYLIDQLQMGSPAFLELSNLAVRLLRYSAVEGLPGEFHPGAAPVFPAARHL